MADHEDFYQILGVSRTATADEIKKAYKKLSRKYHPDKNQGDKNAEKQFKKIQVAYSVLSDPESRKKYDTYGANWDKVAGPEGFDSGRWSTGPGGIDLSDILGEMFSGFGGFGDMGGGRTRGGWQQPVARPAKGEDVSLEITVPFLTAVEGGEHDLRYRYGGQEKRLSVKIPAGVDDGAVIRLKGEGHPGFQGGPAGDLKLTLRIEPHPWFRREGNNVLLELPLTVPEAVLGSKVEVPTLSEGTVVVSIPPGSSSGRKIRLKGMGIPDRQTKARGDQYVQIKIVVPRQLDEETKALYEQIASLTQENPRAGLW